MDKCVRTAVASVVALNLLSKLQDQSGQTSPVALLVVAIPPFSVDPKARGTGATPKRNADGRDATDLLVRPSPKRAAMALTSFKNIVGKSPVDGRTSTLVQTMQDLADANIAIAPPKSAPTVEQAPTSAWAAALRFAPAVSSAGAHML